MKHLPLLILLLLSSCSPGYVIRAAYEESKIIINREKISDYINSESATEEEKLKLSLVMEAREYAKEIGLKPGGSFKYYTRLPRSEAAWVISACPKLSLDSYTWWFPFVGSVPYKGFFDKEAAEKAAAALERQGLEVSIRPTDAFSTLGWFDDPLLSPVLRYEPANIVNLVIHESFHSTHWVKGDAERNESMANYVGLRGALNFFSNKALEDRSQTDNFIRAAENFNNEIKLAKLIRNFYEELDLLYKSDAPEHIKLEKKDGLFAKHNSLIRKKFPYFRSIKNNSELLQLKIYLGKPF